MRSTSRTSIALTALVAAVVVAGAATGAGAVPQQPAKTVAGPTTLPPATLPPTSPTAVVTPVAAGVTTLPAPTTTLPGTGGIVLVDDTSRITVTVPADWTQSDTRPSIRDDGGRRPTIGASPDLEAWTDNWATPGMFVSALPPDADPATLLRGYNFSGVCTDEGVVPYADGRFNGLTQTWSHCGGGETSVMHVAARSADNGFAIFLQLQVTTPGDPAAATILGSIAPVPGANPGEESQIAAPPTPVGAVPEALLNVPVPDGTTEVTDRLGRVSLSIPAAWTDISDSPGTNDDLSRRPHLVAAPNIDEYASSWTAEGVEAFAFPYRPDPYTIILNRAWFGGCEDGGVQTLAIREYVGLMQTWKNCGNTQTRLVTIAVAPPDESHTIYIEVQLPTADDTALTTALASFELS